MSNLELDHQLAKAVLEDDIAHAQELLHMGASPDAHHGSSAQRPKDPCYRTVLMVAAQSKKPAMLKLLLSFKPKKIDLCDTDGMTALHHAIIHERWDAIDLLLAAGARMDAKGGYGMEPPPLHTAVYADQREGHLRRTKHLLERGARPLVTNGAGRTTFDIATDETRDVLVNHAARMEKFRLRKVEDIASTSSAAIKIRKFRPRHP